MRGEIPFVFCSANLKHANLEFPLFFPRHSQMYTLLNTHLSVSIARIVLGCPMPFFARLFIIYFVMQTPRGLPEAVTCHNRHICARRVTSLSWPISPFGNVLIVPIPVSTVRSQKHRNYFHFQSFVSLPIATASLTWDVRMTGWASTHSLRCRAQVGFLITANICDTSILSRKKTRCRNVLHFARTQSSFADWKWECFLCFCNQSVETGMGTDFQSTPDVFHFFTNIPYIVYIVCFSYTIARFSLDSGSRNWINGHASSKTQDQKSSKPVMEL